MLRRSRIPPTVAAIAGTLLLLAACAPAATPQQAPTPATVSQTPPAVAQAPACATTPIPTVAVIEFENTTSDFGTTVVGIEGAAAARVITLLKESNCYVVVERSELQTIIERQGMESLNPVELAKAAGAGYVVTGTVTRATIAAPSIGLFGLTIGNTTAQVEVDVRATDIVTGVVVVSMTGSGEASSASVAVNWVPGVGRISYDDPEVGPLLAEAANEAVAEVVAAIRTEF